MSIIYSKHGFLKILLQSLFGGEEMWNWSKAENLLIPIDGNYAQV